MNKYRVISAFLVVIAWFMFASAGIIQHNINLKAKSQIVVATDIVEKKDLAASKRVLNKINDSSPNIEKIEAVSMEAVPVEEEEVVIPERVEVYENMTLEELSMQLNKSLKNELSGKGELIAGHALDVGVDPVVATAIMLHETGCNWRCSNLMVSCNNVGGQKGSPSCGGGSYKAYPTLDDGIIGMINNLARNYYSRGLTTVEAIGPRYAESDTWVSKINSYVYSIRSR